MKLHIKEKIMTEPSKPQFGAAAEIGKIKGTPLHFIWICDVSDSMRHGKRIEELNIAIEKAINSLKDFNKKTPTLQIFMRTIKFSTGAEWLDRDNVPVQSYQFSALESDRGVTDLGEALSKVADMLRYKKDGGLMPEARSKKPHHVLVTDGYPTDDWESGLKKLMSTFWGENANRMAVALGDAANDEEALSVLKQFVGNVKDQDKKLLRADNPQHLTECLEILSHMAQVPGENYGLKPSKSEIPKIPDKVDMTDVPVPSQNDVKEKTESSATGDSPDSSKDPKNDNITEIPDTVHTY